MEHRAHENGRHSREIFFPIADPASFVHIVYHNLSKSVRQKPIRSSRQLPKRLGNSVELLSETLAGSMPSVC